MFKIWDRKRKNAEVGGRGRRYYAEEEIARQKEMERERKKKRWGAMIGKRKKNREISRNSKSNDGVTKKFRERASVIMV